jgi:hypothetical protein
MRVPTFFYLSIFYYSVKIYHMRCPYNGRINGGLYASLHIARDDGPSLRAADAGKQRYGRFPLPRSYSCFIILLIQCNRDTTSFCCIYFGGRAVREDESEQATSIRGHHLKSALITTREYSPPTPAYTHVI